MAKGTVQSLHMTASAHMQAGRTQQATELLLQIARTYPNEAKSRFLLGLIAHRGGRLEEALDWLNQSVKINPAPAEPYFPLGLLFQKQKRLPEAIDAYRNYLARKPGDGKALNNLGRAILDTGDVSQAIDILQKAVAAAPSNAGAHTNLGDAFRIKGDIPAAMEQYRRAISIDPNCAEAHGSLGTLSAKMGQTADSIGSIQRAIAISPRAFGPRFNLARVFQDSGRLDEALQQCQVAVEIQPNSADAHNLLGNLLGIAGWIPQCIESQRKAVQLKPDHSAAHSNMLLSMHYLPDMSAADIFAEHLKWADQHATASATVEYRNDRNINRRLRIGFVSPNFNNHSVAYFFEPVLAAHDRSVVEVFCYSDAGRGDATTGRLRILAENWREIAGKSNAGVLAMIRNDTIDILVDLAGHTAGNRLPMFARRPAPVQMTWIGYPGSTGMKAIDYRLTDPIADPPGTGEALHVEKLLRIEGGCWAYQAPADAPPIGSFPSIASGFVTFGSFNNLPKVTPKVIETWARILSLVPNSRMLIKSSGLNSRMGREYVLKHFSQFGIPADRIELIGWQPTTAAHLQLYDRIDIALDTFPYNGTTTTCEALWMGVPVVTFAGQTHVSRVGAALLSHAGLSEWIAGDVENYVALAVKLAGELQNLTATRKGLREKLKTSSICDPIRLARQLEAIYRQAWSVWCNGDK